jgi:hypothetical protein
MAERREDFWPENLIDAADPEPLVLLKDQASLLGEKTRNAVEGVIKTSTGEGNVYYALCLKADALGDYLYEILHIAYPVLRGDDAYPVKVQSSEGGPEVHISDSDEFREWLRGQLSSDFVRRAIANLLRSVREVRQSAAAR